MAVNVRIPTAMRSMTNGEAVVSAPVGTVADTLTSLERSYPGFEEVLFDSSGDLRRFVAIFADQDDIRTLDGLATALDDGSTMTIISAVAGG